MPTSIVPIPFGVSRASELLNANGDLYLFASDHRLTTNTDIPKVTEATSNTYYAPWQQMIMGKKVTQAAVGVRNIPYTFNIPYDRYDDQMDLVDRDWYAIVNAGSYSHVYVCLDNNAGANSTIQPDFAQATASDDFSYRTSDGYEWKYMCSTPSSTVANLATAGYFPIIANTVVGAAAIDGAIDVVAVDFSGKRYDNYLSGTFQASDIRVDASPTVYQLSNSTIRSVNGYYTGCVMLITSGTGVGQYATVTDFVCTANGNFANLDVAFPITPTNGSRFELMPGVRVASDGTQTETVVARALVNALASNSVYRVEVLNSGSGFRYPSTASVVANAVVGVTTPAQVRPIMPPRGGHGYSAGCELGATVSLFGVTLSNTEAGTIPATNQYRQIGLMRGPRFANVQLTVSGATGLFSQGETLKIFTPVTRAVNASCNTTSAQVNVPFTYAFSNGDPIFLSDGLNSLFSTVNAIINSTALTLASNSTFAGANTVTLYSPGATDSVIVTNPAGTTNVYVSNCGSSVNVGSKIYGSVSRATATVSGVIRNDVSKSFNTFVQLRKYRVTTLGGTFVQNETVFQGNTSALVHSANSTYLFVSNQTGPFIVPGPNITGNTSGAIASPTVAYDPEVVFGSATIEYLENVEPLTRGPTEFESFVIPYLF